MLQKFLAWLKSLFDGVETKVESVVKDEVRPVVTGFIPGEKDDRDHIYTGAPGPTGPASNTPPPTSDVTFGQKYEGGNTNLGLTSLPASVDLTPLMPPIDNQSTINSCVGHAVSAAFQVLTKTTKRSRLFTYYNARVIANQQNYDAGSTVRNALKAVASQGISAETTWPYVTSQVTVKPPAASYSDGLPTKSGIASYATVASFDAFKTALSKGMPVMFGFMVPASFRTTTATTGIQQLQQPGEAIIGGHCVLAVGYDDATQMVKVRNSFGTSWGKAGYFYMPYPWFVKIGAFSGNLIIDPWVMVPVGA